ncbi:MAG: NAD(P)-dependent oxidoreductase [Nanoarchaeota archaeon]|nr:NAD(P)-dependent oxidoreductase [Nanoarchaeota archaeon]
MLKNKKILITGGSGFIGTNLSIYLSKKGAKITNVGIGEPQIKIKNTKNIDEDLTKSDFWFLKDDFDYVIHLAALSNPKMCENKKKAFEVNVEMTEKFFQKLHENIVKKRLKKIVFMSTVLVYSKDNAIPIKEDGKLDIEKNAYAKTKGIDEELCKRYINKGLPIVVFRLSNIYGPYQLWQGNANLVPQLMRSAILYKKMEIKTGVPVRDWIYAEDAAEAIALSLESDFSGIMNLGTGKGVNVKKITKLIKNYSGAEITDLKQNNDSINIICDISKIKKVLKWKPKTSIETGLQKTFKYYKKTIKNQHNIN